MKKFIQAARLRTLPLSVSGIILAGFFAFEAGIFNGQLFALAILTTIGFQIVSNFANDYGDGIKGTDAHRTGEKRLVASGDISAAAMKRAVVMTSLVTFCLALLLIYSAFGDSNMLYSLFFFFLGIAALMAAIKYTVGKSAYGYQGLGDLFVFLFFGWVSVIGGYFLFSKSLQVWHLLPATSIGLLSTAVLNLNNMRDQYNDKLANKNTLVVTFGDTFAKRYHTLLLLGAFVGAALYTWIYFESPYQWLFLVAFIPLTKHLIFVLKNKNVVNLDGELKIVALSTFLFAVLFGLGLVL